MYKIKKMNRIIRLVIAGSMLAGLAAVPAFADNTTSTAGSSVISANALQCAQAAISKRESAVSAAWSAFSGSVTSALSARSSALNTAWGNTDRKERRTAINAAWKAFNSSVKDARKTLRASEKSAWSAFRSDSKNCKVRTNEGDNEAAILQ